MPTGAARIQKEFNHSGSSKRVYPHDFFSYLLRPQEVPKEFDHKGSSKGVLPLTFSARLLSSIRILKARLIDNSSRIDCYLSAANYLSRLLSTRKGRPPFSPMLWGRAPGGPAKNRGKGKMCTPQKRLSPQQAPP